MTLSVSIALFAAPSSFGPTAIAADINVGLDQVWAPVPPTVIYD